MRCSQTIPIICLSAPLRRNAELTQQALYINHYSAPPPPGIQTTDHSHITHTFCHISQKSFLSPLTALQNPISNIAIWKIWRGKGGEEGGGGWGNIFPKFAQHKGQRWSEVVVYRHREIIHIEKIQDPSWSPSYWTTTGEFWRIPPSMSLYWSKFLTWKLHKVHKW